MEIKVLFLLWSFCILGTIWVLIKGEKDDA
jgi:hypothetical protein